MTEYKENKISPICTAGYWTTQYCSTEELNVHILQQKYKHLLSKLFDVLDSLTKNYKL